MRRWTADVPPLEVKASIPFFNDRISRFGSHFAVISVGPVFYHPRPVLFLTKACPLMEDIVLRNRHAVVVYKPWSKATGRTRSSEVYPKCDQNATHVFSVKNPSFRRVLVGDTRTSPEYLLPYLSGCYFPNIVSVVNHAPLSSLHAEPSSRTHRWRITSSLRRWFSRYLAVISL